MSTRNRHNQFDPTILSTHENRSHLKVLFLKHPLSQESHKHPQHPHPLYFEQKASSESTADQNRHHNGETLPESIPDISHQLPPIPKRAMPMPSPAPHTRPSLLSFAKCQTLTSSLTVGASPQSDIVSAITAVRPSAIIRQRPKVFFPLRQDLVCAGFDDAHQPPKNDKINIGVVVVQ